MNERFTPYEPEALDPDQRAVYDAIRSGPRGSVPRIFHLFLASPDLAARVQHLGAFCRYGTDLPPRHSELGILIVARHWKADYEWSVHEREARKAGLPDDVIAALAEDRRPDFKDDDAAELVYEFCTTYLGGNDVPDPLFTRAVEQLGRKTVVELTGLMGYYSMLAMAIRIFRLTPE